MSCTARPVSNRSARSSPPRPTPSGVGTAWTTSPTPTSRTGPPSSAALAQGGDAEEPPRAGHAFEVVLAPVGEADAGSHHQILDGARHQHLASVGGRRHPGPDVDCHAADID